MSDRPLNSPLKNESVQRALVVTLIVAFSCAVLVSMVAIGLRPLQLANIEAEREAQLELVLNALADIGEAQSIDKLEAHLVELDSGNYDDDRTLPTSRSTSGRVIPAEADLAGIRQRANYAQIYLIRDPQKTIQLIILPVWGRGYQSTLSAWLVLTGDTATVRALKFYEHGETPGIGARIQEPAWEALWHDAPIYDENGILRIGVKLQAGSDSNSSYLVDGISGATRTTQGVDGLIRFWLGDFGFGPYLQRLRSEAL